MLVPPILSFIVGIAKLFGTFASFLFVINKIFNHMCTNWCYLAFLIKMLHYITQRLVSCLASILTVACWLYMGCKSLFSRLSMALFEHDFILLS